MFGILTALLVGLQTAAPTPAGTTASPRVTDVGVAPAPLPALPAGKSTVLGGEIRNLDPVRDQFTLRISDKRSLTVLFDERTKVYRDGEVVPVLALRPESHASVETTLDGDKIFALKIHTLSVLPNGSYRGLVTSFDTQTGMLRLTSASSQAGVTVRVPEGTPIDLHIDDDSKKTSEGSRSSLVPGAAVAVSFTGGRGGTGLATRVDVLSAPGSVATFQGELSSFDSKAGRLFLEDVSSQRVREFAFDPKQVKLPTAAHEGSSLRVTARYDGSLYTATSIAME